MTIFRPIGRSRSRRFSAVRSSKLFNFGDPFIGQPALPMFIADIVAVVQLDGMTGSANMLVRPNPHILEFLGAAIAALGFLEHALLDWSEFAREMI